MILGHEAPFVLTEANDDFPSPTLALKDPNGLLAIGASLSMTQLLKAYRKGIFPWFNQEEPICWWSPDPRCLLLPNDFKPSHSLKKTLKKPYTVTFDQDFETVIRACAAPRDIDVGTWITSEMQQAYIELFHQGYAHSVEVWHQNQLAGGLYGISLGRAFFGESMFHTKPDTSKLALHALCQKLLAWDFDFIDCQLPSDHLSSLGAKNVPREVFLKQLKATLTHPDKRGRW